MSIRNKIFIEINNRFKINNNNNNYNKPKTTIKIRLIITINIIFPKILININMYSQIT